MSKIEALLKGIGSVLDISGASLPHIGSESSNGYEIDSKKIAGDWRKVGNDIRKADKAYVRRK